MMGHGREEIIADGIMPQSVASTKMHNLVLSCYVVNISSNAHAAPKLVSVQLDSHVASFKFHTPWISVENTDVQDKISDDGFALALGLNYAHLRRFILYLKVLLILCRK